LSLIEVDAWVTELKEFIIIIIITIIVTTFIIVFGNGFRVSESRSVNSNELVIWDVDA
jgi:hypothetical protein